MDANTKQERNLSVKVNSPEGEKYTKNILKIYFYWKYFKYFSKKIVF